MNTKLYLFFFLNFGVGMLFQAPMFAQINNYPAPPNTRTMAIQNATIHLGKDGKKILSGTIVWKGDKIVYVGEGKNMPLSFKDATVIDGEGKHVYPGLILAHTQIGLREIAAVRASVDEEDVGSYNTNINAAIAYNADSRIIPNVRANGILLANVAPIGDAFAGKSSVMQLDAWNWEDAIYASGVATYLYLPRLVEMPKTEVTEAETAYQKDLKKVDRIIHFLKQAKAYCTSADPTPKNMHFESLRPLFKHNQKLFIYSHSAKQMLIALEIMKSMDVDVVIVGGSDSWKMASLLKKYQIPVILESIHALPTTEDDDIKQPFLLPSLLQKEGILVALTQENSHDRGLNLAYLAGTAACYGMDKEQALSLVTYNPAKILGIEQRTGSLENGKDANIVVAAGDIMDMKESRVEDIYIQGRKVNLDNTFKQLEKRYLLKYGLPQDHP